MPVYVDFPRSDGSPDNWPVNDPRFFEEPFDSRSIIAWREYLGEELAKELKFPGLTGGAKYILRELPAGYKLFRRPRTVQAARHIGDLHLYGLKYHKGLATAFRSAQEFLPHAIWLFSDDEFNLCPCKYCAKGPGRKHKPRPIKRLESPSEKVDIAAQNSAILKAFLGKLDIRIQEVVWVHLFQSISLSSGDSDSESEGLSIDFWPAVVTSIDCDNNIASVNFLGMSKTQALSTSRLLPYHAYEIPTAITSKLSNIESLENSSRPTTLDTYYLKALCYCSEIEKTYCISPGSPELEVWIGPELVCAGDFVFLKVPRDDLPINRTVLAPSGPGSSMQELLPKNLSALTDGMGSLDPSRGVLLGIASFVVEDEVNIIDSSVEVFAKGILYEFADDDWVWVEDADQLSSSSDADICDWNSSQLQIVCESDEARREIGAPVPPAGFQLRQILSPGYQALVSLQGIKARYYPCMASHPLLCDAKSRSLCHGGLKQELRQIPSRKDVIDKATY